MAETDSGRRFLVTAPDDNLYQFHHIVALTLNGIERREQTVIYTCMAADAEYALFAAAKADVTLQELEITNDGQEIYPVRYLGSHGLMWVRPSARDQKRKRR